MAKKGSQQQLQADIQTDEEFDKFLERKGLLVMDVYTEWCGPCLAMVGSLKKIKLELGGDNLHLAACKSDSIEALRRFRNKSEPTWLFASHSRIVNIMFGTNVPKLMSLIANELEIELSFMENKTLRTFYEKHELLPIEQERLNIIIAAENEAKQIEKEEAERKRREYLTHVTNEINLNLPEYGVTIFAPHVSRDLFKKIMDPAEELLLSCKDRRVTQIVPENLEVLHFKCENPLDEDVLNYIFNKDVMMCLWKLEKPDTSVEEALKILVHKLTEPTPVYDEFGLQVPDANIPPLIQPYEVMPTKEKIMHDEKKAPEEIGEKIPDIIFPDFDLDFHPEETPVNIPECTDKISDSVTSTYTTKPEIPNKEVYDPGQSPRIIILPMWTPADRVTNAAAIYLYFRSQTETFLLPDPIPDPPHIAIAFEAYKRKEIMELCDRYKEALLAYGYFDSANPDQARLIANSTKKYETQAQTVHDKLVLKVAKVTSHAILALSGQGPTHVSQNTVLGEKECRKFFPEGYKTGEDEEMEATTLVDTSAKKKKKKKKKTESGEVGESADSGLGTLISDSTQIDEVELAEGEEAEEQGGEEQLQDASCEIGGAEC